MKSKRFTKKDWIELGLKDLATYEAEAITIDTLCESASKTKGSFYFHFASIEDFLITLTKAWYEKYTHEIIKTKIANTKRLDLLNQLAARIDLDLETGIRQLALRNQQVQEFVSKADSNRISWLAELYQQSGKYNKSEATALAHIEIAAFTGFKLINPDMKPTQARDFYQSFLKFTSRA